MTLYHVVVTGSRPEKGSDNKFKPMPKENVEFIRNFLDKIPAEGYAALYHGMAQGVDSVVDDYAFEKHIRVRQFPAYWFDPTKPNNSNKGAGLFRNEAMVRAAKDAVYNRPDHAVVLLAFYNTPALADSRGTHHCFSYAQQHGLTVRSFQLPVLIGNAEQQNPATSAVPW